MNKNHLLTKDISSLLKSIAIPASTGLLFNTFYNIVDIFYAGLISTGALAGISYSASLYFMLFGTSYGFLLGLKALIGNSLGENKIKLAILYSHQGISFSLLIALFVFCISYIFNKDIFSLLNVSSEYMYFTTEYFDVIIFSFFAVLVNVSINSILTSKGDSKSYRNTLIFGFFLNLVLNPIFIYGFLFIPPMGVSGIALSTVLIGFINMFYLLYKISSINMLFFDKPLLFVPRFIIYKNIIYQGVASGFNMFVMSIGAMLVLYFASMYGQEAVAGYGIGIRIEQIFLLPALGINTAILAIVSNNFGAKYFDRIEQSLYIALKYSFSISVVGLIVLLTTGHFLVSLFSDNIFVIQFAFMLIIVDAFTFFAYCSLFIGVALLQGIKQTKMIFYISLVRQTILPITIYYLVAVQFKLPIVYLFLSTLVITYICAIWILLYIRYKLKILRKTP